jgi:hypothetical protein
MSNNPTQPKTQEGKEMKEIETLEGMVASENLGPTAYKECYICKSNYKLRQTIQGVRCQPCARYEARQRRRILKYLSQPLWYGHI